MYKQEIIPFSHGNTIGFTNNPDRVEFLNKQAEDGWMFVSSFLHTCYGKDISYEGYPVTANRLREFMTFRKEA